MEEMETAEHAFRVAPEAQVEIDARKARDQDNEEISGQAPGNKITPRTIGWIAQDEDQP